MCNRYVSPDERAIESYWSIGRRNPSRFWDTVLLPRGKGPFIRARDGARELVVGQWGLIPHFARTARLPYSTNNARSEELAQKPTFRTPWAKGQRCIIPAESFDEPCWETGKNVWWRFRRADHAPWALAGLWSTWSDRESGEVFESYTMLTLRSDSHPLMRRMHKPKPGVPVAEQDKRSVVPIELGAVDKWLTGSMDEARALLVLPGVAAFDAAPLL